MRAPSPAFSLYPKDIESDETCKAMTHAEFGMYMRLLLNCWTEGSIPSDPIRLQRLLKVSSKTFKACWPAIEPCFTPAGDRLTQSRLEEERTKQRERSSINSENGRDGAKAKKSKKDGKRTLQPDEANAKQTASETQACAGASSSSPSSSPETDLNQGRSVEGIATATPDGTPVILPALDEPTATAPRRLTPQTLGIQVNPANFAQVQLSHDLTALVDVDLRDIDAKRGTSESWNRESVALDLLHAISTTPAGKRIETLDLRRVSTEWATVSSHAAYKLAAEVYGVDLANVGISGEPNPAETSPALKSPEAAA